MNQFDEFYQLHYSNSPLVIGNVWDAGSAKFFEQAGFKAIATSSAAVANTFGFEDGEHIPFELLLQTARHIKQQVGIPVSVDMEAGYSTNINGIIDNITKLYNAGIAGINIEDSDKGMGATLQPAGVFAKTIEAIANHLERNNTRVFINARTDAFLRKLPSARQETLERAKLCEQAGANGLFVPFLYDEEDISNIVKSTKLPVNVFAGAKLPGFNRLAVLGVKRISMGKAVYNKMNKLLQQTLASIQQDASFNCLY